MEGLEPLSLGATVCFIYADYNFLYILFVSPSTPFMGEVEIHIKWLGRVFNKIEKFV